MIAYRLWAICYVDKAHSRLPSLPLSPVSVWCSAYVARSLCVLFLVRLWWDICTGWRRIPVQSHHTVCLRSLRCLSPTPLHTPRLLCCLVVNTSDNPYAPSHLLCFFCAPCAPCVPPRRTCALSLPQSPVLLYLPILCSKYHSSPSLSHSSYNSLSFLPCSYSGCCFCFSRCCGSSRMFEAKCCSTVMKRAFLLCVMYFCKTHNSLLSLTHPFSCRPVQ